MTRFMTPVLLAGIAVAGPAQAKDLLAVITPSPDNPSFKAEADGAEARAGPLGCGTIVPSHDDGTRQDQIVDPAVARGAKATILDNAGSDAGVAPMRVARAS